MAINTINRAYTNDEGISNPVICPSCGKTVGMRLFTTFDVSLVGIISKEDKNVNFAVCPLCSSVFSVATNYAKERASGTSVIMTENDLTPINRK